MGNNPTDMNECNSRGLQGIFICTVGISGSIWDPITICSSHVQLIIRAFIIYPWDDQKEFIDTMVQTSWDFPGDYFLCNFVLDTEIIMYLYITYCLSKGYCT